MIIIRIYRLFFIVDTVSSIMKNEKKILIKRIDIVKVHSCFYIDCEKLQARFDKESYKNHVSIMSKTLQELTAHFPAKWDEITIRASQDQFLIKKSDEIFHDGWSIFNWKIRSISTLSFFS